MKIRCLLTLFLAWMGSAVQAAVPVTGDVSFDASSGLYTYSYVVDTDVLTAGGNLEFAILSNSTPSHHAPLPVAHTEPQGWNLLLAVGGWAQPPIQVHGSSWMWLAINNPVNPGELLTFSFSTPHAPDTGSANNYFVYASRAAGPDNLPVSFGRVAGPDLTIPVVEPTVVPEPASLLLWLAGALVLGRARSKRLRPAG